MSSAQKSANTNRVVIEDVTPRVDDGRYPVKRIVGDVVEVEADVFADGHDAVAAVVRYRRSDQKTWRRVPMEAVVNDRWRASFPVDEVGRYVFTVEGWVDHFLTWTEGIAKKAKAGVATETDLEIGAGLMTAGAERATGPARAVLKAAVASLGDDSLPVDERVADATEPGVLEAMAAFPDRSRSTVSDRVYEVWVDRERARFSAWYELFPRSWGEGGRHGTFADVENHLEYISDMGFDVLYLPPIHPIGTAFRKGPNNTLESGPLDPGVPWAIGNEDGGHMAVHPDLGTLDDFRRLRRRAEDHGMEVALDIAFQCSPDHPWVEEHPEWFQHRPDGSIQYAENPPKKYEDIYPLDFETSDPAGLWKALKGVFEFWIGEGVHIFRVDNPHTKAFPFWEWAIGELKGDHPEVIFLAEAFTRPKVMNRLAKLGFTQSYTYFTWRNTGWELAEYLTELTRGPAAEFFRPNFWPNTPDILTEYLQTGGRPAFITRLVLAATLSSNYGIYGPAFELMENTPRHPGSEEYMDSEKYQLRHWELDRPDSLAPVIAQVNRVRHAHPALQHTDGLRFHPTDNESLLCYSKLAGDDLILVVVNLDPAHVQSGWTNLPLGELGIDPEHPYQVHDLLVERRYMWQGPHNFVRLDPHAMPAHVFAVRRKVRTEHDFDYFA
ncbi:MAG TPA: alpha-1,4-glucan--maltose-1-phosphate maltosyltransferase [Acidimicrobiia bacterium]|nr:alpha-1,4-glucan--maltose-1-phosphate maltosyltransferase [Acidimicrobiia bacterium]